MLPVPAASDCLIIQQDPEPGSDRKEASPFEALSDIVVQLMETRCEERMAKFQTMAQETYKEAVTAVDLPHQDQLDPELVDRRAQALAKAPVPPDRSSRRGRRGGQEEGSASSQQGESLRSAWCRRSQTRASTALSTWFKGEEELHR